MQFYFLYSHFCSFFPKLIPAHYTATVHALHPSPCFSLHCPLHQSLNCSSQYPLNTVYIDVQEEGSGNAKWLSHMERNTLWLQQRFYRSTHQSF